MTGPHAAAIYARISQDVTGEELGVGRQLEDCRKLAADRGWSVTAEYVDNDLSAYTGKPRPNYERMLEAIESGRVDAVICYHQDRLTRRPIEFEQFVELCQRAGMDRFATVTSDVSFGNDDGMFTARILAAVAANESARKAKRVKRSIQQKAERGLPNGGAVRPFGYEADRVTVRESEAELIRQTVDRFLARESMTSIVEWFRAQEVPTVSGGEWRTVTIRQIITNPRIAGWRVLNGEIVAEAIWPGIIDKPTFERVQAEHARRTATGWRPARRHALSGLLRCGKCGTKLFSTSRDQRRIYRCMKGTDHGGCGGISISAAPVEEWLTEAVLHRLDSPTMHAAISGQRTDDELTGTLNDDHRRLTAQSEELAQEWAQGAISRAEWKAAREPLHARIADVERQLAALAADRRLDGLAGQGQALRAQWASLNMSRQSAIISAVLDYATIMPSPPSKFVNPERIVATWRV